MKIEPRYVVLKIKDIHRYIPEDKWILMQESICDEIAKKRREEGRPDLDCICIEKDWPEYAPTLKLLSERVDRSTMNKVCGSCKLFQKTSCNNAKSELVGAWAYDTDRQWIFPGHKKIFECWQPID